MADDITMHPSQRLGKLPRLSPSVYGPKLRWAYESGGRDLRPRLAHELLPHLEATQQRRVVEAGVAAGYLKASEANKGRTYVFTEMARLIYLDTDDAAATAMPMYLQRHREVYAAVYEYLWENLPAKGLAAKFGTNHVPEPDLRGAAFPEEKAIADAAREGVLEQFRALVRQGAVYAPTPRGPRVPRPQPSTANTPTVENDGDPTPTPTPVPAPVSASSLAPMLMLSVGLGMRVEYHRDGRVLYTPLP